jgi:amidase
MSIFSLDVDKSNPVTVETVDDLCRTLGVTIKDDEKADYQRLLGIFHESAAALMALPDYVPPVDTQRFPREQVRFPDASENPLGAWAWRCHIEDKEKRGGLLSGKTVAVKDNIAVKDVPMLLGTDFVKDFVPVCPGSCYRMRMLLTTRTEHGCDLRHTTVGGRRSHRGQVRL